jgi:phosphoglycolate phosphatase
MADPVLIFDLDGTLVDSAPDLTHSLNWTLGEAGLPAVGLDDVRNMVGLGARRLIERGIEKGGGIAESRYVDRLLGLFLHHYERNLVVDTKAFEDVPEILDGLAGKARLGICTNKPERLAVDLLSALGLIGRFPVVLGGDSLPWKKPDRRHLDAVRRRLASDGPAIMVGDSITDIEGARNAGIPVVAVTYGYSTAPIRDLSPDIAIDRFRDLPAAIERLNANGPA